MVQTMFLYAIHVTVQVFYLITANNKYKILVELLAPFNYFPLHRCFEPSNNCSCSWQRGL